MPANYAFSDFFSAIAQRGRSIIGIRGDGKQQSSSDEIVELCNKLLSSNGEASGIALSFEILERYQLLDTEEKQKFFFELYQNFAAEPLAVQKAATAYLADPSLKNLGELSQLTEPTRRKLIIRLNQAPNATHLLIQMRGDLLDFLPNHPELKELDRDFVKLFASWFNGGFLQLRNLDWSSPAEMLEKIMHYEAVHGMAGWHELRDRIAPQDRLIYGFFHPRLGTEPLIFIEVALMKDMPAQIDEILLPSAPPLDPSDARTAVFYSISNCQKGLRGIPLGSFLIKRVVEDLKKQFPDLKDFVTLSPVPGFAKWLDRLSENKDLPPELKHEFEKLMDGTWQNDNETAAEIKHTIEAAAAYYLSKEKDPKNKPADPVAKFHLGNGARLERVNWPADLSANGILNSYGLMVNYCYKLDEIERNHEMFVRTGKVKITTSVAAHVKAFDKAVNQSNARDRSLV